MAKRVTRRRETTEEDRLRRLLEEYAPEGLDIDEELEHVYESRDGETLNYRRPADLPAPTGQTEAEAEEEEEAEDDERGEPDGGESREESREPDRRSGEPKQQQPESDPWKKSKPWKPQTAQEIVDAQRRARAREGVGASQDRHPSSSKKNDGGRGGSLDPRSPDYDWERDLAQWAN